MHPVCARSGAAIAIRIRKAESMSHFFHVHCFLLIETFALGSVGLHYTESLLKTDAGSFIMATVQTQRP